MFPTCENVLRCMKHKHTALWRVTRYIWGVVTWLMGEERKEKPSDTQICFQLFFPLTECMYSVTFMWAVQSDLSFIMWNSWIAATSPSEWLRDWSVSLNPAGWTITTLFYLLHPNKSFITDNVFSHSHLITVTSSILTAALLACKSSEKLFELY